MKQFIWVGIAALFIAIAGGDAILQHVRNHSSVQLTYRYRVRAEHGDIAAQYELGRSYFTGRGVPKDYEESVRWYRSAAGRGYAPAQSSLGFMYEQGIGVSRDYAEALQWYRKAADEGDADAEYNLGTMYRLGLGVSQNYVEAAKWYQMASDQGDRNGQYGLGYMYYNGEGVKRDFAMAARLYRRAADQGLARAQYDLAYMYYDGHGVAPDRSEGDRLLHQAATQGEPRAQRSLGINNSGLWGRRKIISLIIFLACTFFLLTSLVTTGRNRKHHQTRLFAGIVGLLYAGLDLYLSFSKSIPPFAKIAQDALLARNSLLGLFSAMVIVILISESRDRYRGRRG